MTPALSPAPSNQQDIVGIYRRHIRLGDLLFLLMALGGMVGVVALSLPLLPTFRVLFLLLLPLLGYIFVVNARDIYRAGTRQIIVYHDAIVEQYPHSTQVFSWEDIAYVWDCGFMTAVGASYTVAVQAVNGQKLILHDMVTVRPQTSYLTHPRGLDLMDVRECIIDKVIPRLSEQAVIDYHNQQVIDLLVFSFNSAGLLYQGALRAWHEIGEIEQVDDRLVITFNTTAQDAISIPFSDIPNIDVFVAVLRRYHGDRYQITQQYSVIPR